MSYCWKKHRVVLLKAVDLLTDIAGSRRTDTEAVCAVSSRQTQRCDSFHERLVVSACRQVCLLAVTCYVGGIVEYTHFSPAMMS